MQKDVLIMGAGFLVALVPFLGFPHAWDDALLILLGIGVIALGIAVRRGPRPLMKLPVVAETPHHDA